jgi:MGT family glycosyltransferase
VAFAIPKVRVPKARFVPEAARMAAALPDAIKGDGVEIIPIQAPVSPRTMWHAIQTMRSTGYDELRHAIGMFTAAMEPNARDVAAAIKRFRADVVVGDYLFFASWLGAELAQRPFAALFHSALPFATTNPPFASGLPAGASKDDPAWLNAQARLDALAVACDRTIAAARARLGLAPSPAAAMSRPYSRDLNLLATVPELEPGLLPLAGGPVVFTGPCITAQAKFDPTDPTLTVLRDDKNRVYVSLGTVFNDKPEVYAAILRALDIDGVQVVVSAGASTERLLAEPPSGNAHVFRSVPQVALLGRVNAVVTHGGNNTVQETLAAGRPMIVIPFGGDQIENARRVERLGAGIAIMGAPSTEAVRTVVDRLLGDASFARRAQELAGALRGVDGVQRAVDAIVGLAERASSGPQAPRHAD